MHTMYNLLLRQKPQTSLVVQWLRIRLPVQGTQVQSLLQEAPTWAHVPQPLSLCSPTREKSKKKIEKVKLLSRV